jgi:hypothetical protein
VHLNGVLERRLAEGEGLGIAEEVRGKGRDRRLQRIKEEVPNTRINYPKRLVMEHKKFIVHCCPEKTIKTAQPQPTPTP